MAGSGVDVASAPVLAATGVDAIHFSAKRSVSEEGGVRMGSASDGVGGYEVTDREIAIAIRDALAR
jgi:copper homeostasis protein